MNGSRGPSRILAAGLLLLVAVLGLLGGVVLDRAVLPGPAIGSAPSSEPTVPLHPGAHAEGRWGERIADRMAADLELSTSQREQLSIVLERQHERLGVAMAEMRPRLEQILEETRREIDAILTPEQRERFESMWTSHH